MRSRNIKPGFYANEDLAECSLWARFIFPGLWMMADREGRLEYRPKKIKGELLRFDNQDVAPLLDELQALGFILIYEANGAKFIQVNKFLDHQNPHHREAESVIPPPQSLGLTQVGNTIKPEALPTSDDDDSEAIPRQAQGKPESEGTSEGGAAGLIPDSGFLIPDSNKKPSSPKAGDGFEKFWSAWPKTDRKAGKAKCAEKWAKAKLEPVATEIIEHVEASKISNRQWRDGYEPAPMTYLNQRRWEDGTPVNGTDRDPEACNPGDRRYVN